MALVRAAERPSRSQRCARYSLYSCSVCDCSGFVQSQHTAVVMTDVMCDTKRGHQVQGGKFAPENGVSACKIGSEGTSPPRWQQMKPNSRWAKSSVELPVGSLPACDRLSDVCSRTTRVFIPVGRHPPAAALAGFDCNARIGVLMPNGPEAILTIVAVACCSIAVPLDPRLSPAEFHQRLDMLRLNALLVPQGSASEARQAAERRRLAIIEAAPVGNGQLGLNIAVQVSDSPAIDAEPDPGSAWSKLALNSVDLVILRSLVQQAMKRRPDADWQRLDLLTRARDLLVRIFLHGGKVTWPQVLCSSEMRHCHGQMVGKSRHLMCARAECA